jgi:hypothetical protein
MAASVENILRKCLATFPVRVCRSMKKGWMGAAVERVHGRVYERMRDEGDGDCEVDERGATVSLLSSLCATAEVGDAGRA